MRIILKILFVFLLVSCSQKANKAAPLPTEIEKKTASDILEEQYVDSILIGVPGKYKLDFRKYRGDSVYVNIDIYKKDGSDWKHIQNFNYLKDGVLSADVEIKDFNNDGLNDFTFQSAIAGRGANTIRKLFICDKENEKFIFIKNSEDYPNIRYNKELNCIDAFRVYGGTQSVFARITADSLQEFANVELFDERIIIKTTDKSGKRTEIKNEKYDGDTYKRFSNYAPLTEFEREY